VQQATTETVVIGTVREPQDVDLNDGLLLATSRIEETHAIKDQGFKSELRLRDDFIYQIVIYSRINEANCNEYATKFLLALPPGVDIHIDYDGTRYAMYLNSIKDAIEYNDQTNFWKETLTFQGFTYLKLV
jgi:hypothetical protein